MGGSNGAVGDKANGIEPHAWLTDVLTRLPTTLDRDIADLLPHTWKPLQG